MYGGEDEGEEMEEGIVCTADDCAGGETVVEIWGEEKSEKLAGTKLVETDLDGGGGAVGGGGLERGGTGGRHGGGRMRKVGIAGRRWRRVGAGEVRRVDAEFGVFSKAEALPLQGRVSLS